MLIADCSKIGEGPARGKNNRRPRDAHSQAAFLVAFDSFDRWMRFERKVFAFCSSARRVLLRPRPARLIKQLSMRIPELGPLGETRFGARVRATTSKL